jgi:hypothetical protein
MWESRNLGFCNRAQMRERRVVAEQMNYQLIEVQTRVGAEITEAAKLAAARFDTPGQRPKRLFAKGLKCTVNC